MLRPSKKTQILDAAVTLIETGGLEAVSYEALAEASNMSKSGIIYHFPSRHEIMRGIHQHLADQWEHELERNAGGPADAVDTKTRLQAMVLSLANSATKTELLLEIDARSNPDFAEIWRQVDERWAPGAAGIEDDETLRAHYLVQLLADGLWLHDYVHEQPLTRAQRRTLTEEILKML
ncbi:MAG TPA: TetR/AcrR family transcriptional regulator [Candidatus Yaniella excrementigallinarum]|nr:TetR/AcrR family transcriptional regulator [Candidatus Yaniella excrementigallinarum]